MKDKNREKFDTIAKFIGSLVIALFGIAILAFGFSMLYTAIKAAF